MDPDNGPTSATQEEPIRCAECGTTLFEGQAREETDGGTFCRPCFDRLTHELGQAVASQGEGINYPMAVVGGLAGAAIGVVVWWGFTVVTNIAFGLVAVVIGFAVGKGVTILAGHKRHLNLQILAVVISIAGFAYASYLVNRSFILQAYAESAEGITLPWLPAPELFVNVISAGFNWMDVLFLGIAVYQAWKIPEPIQLSPAA